MHEWNHLSDIVQQESDEKYQQSEKSKMEPKMEPKMARLVCKIDANILLLQANKINNT